MHLVARPILAFAVSGGDSMSSLVWLGLVVVLVVDAVLTHLTPKGGKPVAGTRLMKTARRILIVGVVVSGAIGVWGAFKH
jgi:hypothetical protein